MVLVATNNTLKKGGTCSGSLCALLWRLLSWCNLRQICLRAGHILGRLNVIADKLSRHQQVIQMEWSLHLDVFAQICHRWHFPKIDMFATSYNSKLPHIPSPQCESLGSECSEPVLGESCSVCVPSDSPAEKCGKQSPQSSVSEADHHSSGLAQHALVLGYGGVVIPDTFVPTKPLDLLTQPFNDSLHRDLQNLNLHSWLLKPRLFGNRVSLTRWRRELKHLRDGLPDLSFLFDGARQIKWTSIHHL